MFKHACKMGLEAIVSKRRDAPYRGGRCKTWLKIKNPEKPRHAAGGGWNVLALFSRTGLVMSPSDA
jgi:hypothetical protein